MWAIELRWDRATRAEARDFCRWMLVAGKPARPHGGGRASNPVPCLRARVCAVGPGSQRDGAALFYDFHLEAGTGPIVNPFPLDRSRRGGRANAHHNPMEPYRSERTGRYRPRVPARIPRSVPDEEFNELFARLPSHRDRALMAF